MKKNQNPLQKPALALLTFNRSIKLMALALIGIFAGVMKSEADTRAVIGRVITSSGSISYEDYQNILARKNPGWELETRFKKSDYFGKDLYLSYKNNELHARLGSSETKFSNIITTTNGLYVRGALYRDNGYIGSGHGTQGLLYVDFNELSVNRAMAAAPIGTLKVTPSNNASEQTKVQWSVE
jgi:hypothetical protein